MGSERVKQVLNLDVDEETEGKILAYGLTLVAWLEIDPADLPEIDSPAGARMKDLGKEWNKLRKELKIRAYKPCRDSDARRAQLVQMYLQLRYEIDVKQPPLTPATRIAVWKMKLDLMNRIEQLKQSKEESLSELIKR